LFVCKSEHRDFTKAKERAADSASLRADFKRDYVNKKLGENMGQSKKERNFKNRKEDFRSKVLKKDFRSKVLKN
jgi:hypothetical protein